MIVVFVLWGTKLTECAEIMVKSCKAQGYEVWQLSDSTAPEIDGVDKCLREPTRGRHAMVYRMDRLAGLPLDEYISLDVDQVVMCDISDGFEDGCDVTLMWRANKEDVRMIYNAGLIFVRNQAFIREVAAETRKLPVNEQIWWGDQIALQKVAQSGKYRIGELRASAWNFKPAYRGERRSGIKIYHCKGNRKDWMKDYL